MTLFTILKLVHVSCALVSIAGFTLRGYWALTDNPWRQARLSRVLPHLVDTLLLGSAIGMLVLWGASPLALPWVLAKILALLLYIGLGMVVMRFAARRRDQLLAYIAALATAGYIVAVARTHSAWGPLVIFW
ncbi:regulator SirB [Seongchinamella sediminis]|uniref:Regulator SirB n=1 Tax=Seongchinamella sediminis TaxID=2283635 RepID=A0A3L7DTI2_9GAMM|nr:SirB2 family protein [Seongchinamella sediminis]RLQ20878.1 regulator SirB [Seongchinamella sediminis]